MGTMSGLEATYVETASLNEGGETYSAFQYYAAAMLIMFLLYSGLSASISLSEEKRKKTLYRLNSMPVSTLEIFMGKIAGNSLVAFYRLPSLFAERHGSTVWTGAVICGCWR